MKTKPRRTAAPRRRRIKKTDTAAHVELLRLAEIGRRAEAAGFDVSGDPADLVTARIVDASTSSLAAGTDVLLPAEVAFAIADGENAVRAVRKWRGLTQVALADQIGISQGDLSEIENDVRKGVEAKIKIARALGVPIDLLVD
jgi:DNA-binding XRE family transcriptional regulator